MCKLCDAGRPQRHGDSRRGFLKAPAAAATLGSADCSRRARRWPTLDTDTSCRRQELEASRDYVFSAAGIPQNLFNSN